MHRLLRWLVTTAMALLLVAPPALAEEQALHYQLLAADRAVGSRDATVKYLPTGSGELRLLEAWTSLLLPLPKGTLRYEQRLGARFGGDRSFVASMATNGEVREVQARQEADGTWSITVASAAGAYERRLEAKAIDLTSAELFDGERALQTLQAIQQLRILSAETGEVLEGPLEALGPSTIGVGPDEVEILRFRFTPPEGSMTLAYTHEGWLVAYDYGILGLLVGARLEKLPPARTFGTVLEGPLTTGVINEESL